MADETPQAAYARGLITGQILATRHVCEFIAQTFAPIWKDPASLRELFPDMHAGLEDFLAGIIPAIMHSERGLTALLSSGAHVASDSAVKRGAKAKTVTDKEGAAWVVDAGPLG